MISKPFKYYFVSVLIGFIILNHFKIGNIPLDFRPAEKIDKFKKFYPADYEMIKRTFPYYNYDKNTYKEAFKNLSKLKKQKIEIDRLNKENSPNWEFVGPTNIGGRVVDIEFNPKNPNIVYLAAATGGVFKSNDKGLSWYPIFDDQPSLTIGDIGIDPNNPNILYVGTGEPNGGHNNFPGIGLFKSIDAGSTWSHIGLDSTVSISRIIIDPNNSERIFVAALGDYFSTNPQRGLFLSENGGITWRKSLFVSDSTGAVDLVMNSNNPNILFAAMWERVRRPIFNNNTKLQGPSGGIFKSIDGGNNWIKLGPENGLPNSNFENIGRIGLSISKSNPSILYALFNDGFTPYGIYKTEDSGNNWIKTNDTFSGAGNFSWFFGQLRVHPNNPEIVFVLDVPLLKSSSSGTSWDYSYGYGGLSQLHVDHHELEFHPNNPDYIISGNDGGINISTDGGESWSEPISLPITQFYEIGLDKRNPERFYGGTQDNNTIRTLTGYDNDWESIFGGDGFYVIIDPNNPNIIYAESQNGFLVKSINGGKTFTSARNGIDTSEPTNWSTPVVMDPQNSNILYYGTHSIYRTENSAQSWVKVSPKLTDHNSDKRLGTVTTIAVAPTNSNIIFAGTDDSFVWVSKDYGSTWENISASLPFRWVTRIAVDPNNENIVYVTFSGLKWSDQEAKVYRSDNMGKSWNEISNNLPDAPVNAFAINPNNTDMLFLGNDIGAFISKNRGNSWEVIANNLPIVVVNDMKIHEIENYLAIGTHGRGIYKIELNSINNQNNDTKILPAQIELSQNYPNPFNPRTRINYSIPANENNLTQNVLITVFNNIGQKITTLANREHSPGNYYVIFDGYNFPSGIYYYTLSAGTYSKTKKMILLK